jgi:hypothetical protein
MTAGISAIITPVRIGPLIVSSLDPAGYIAGATVPPLAVHSSADAASA